MECAIRDGNRHGSQMSDRPQMRERKKVEKSDMTCPLLSKSDVEPEQRAHTHPAHQKALKWSKAEKNLIS